MKRMKKTSNFIGKHQLISMIIIALLISVAMTGISLWLYRSSGAFQLDFSRPGREQARKEVNQSDDKEEPFSSSGSLTPEAIDDFHTRLDKLQTNLNAIGDFGGETLSDSNLGLEPTGQTEQSE